MQRGANTSSTLPPSHLPAVKLFNFIFTGRPGQISEAQQSLPEGAQHMRNVKPANPAQFDGFL